MKKAGSYGGGSKVVKLENILPSQSISKKNFERNLKNANEEIRVLRKQL